MKKLWIMDAEFKGREEFDNYQDARDALYDAFKNELEAEDSTWDLWEEIGEEAAVYDSEDSDYKHGIVYSIDVDD